MLAIRQPFLSFDEIIPTSFKHAIGTQRYPMTKQTFDIPPLSYSTFAGSNV
jgi:hypothetical protein